MLTNDDIADCQFSLLKFTETLFRARKNSAFVINRHHELICNAMEQVVIGKIKRLIINIPPRYSKTELAVVNFIAWCMGNFPDCEFIHASYSKRLATNNTWNARTVMMHEIYAQIFGAPKFAGDSNAKDEYRTQQGGCVYATGTEGTITGYGAGKLRDEFAGAIIIDDPHKAGEANSETMRQNVIDWFSTTLESRTNSPNTPIVVIMQRLHEEDLSGWLLNGGNGEKWEHLKIPALDENDLPLWPFKHSFDELERLKNSNPYVFAGQYMQEPAPRGGGLLKTEWWQFWRVLPELEYRVIYADTAQKTKEHNDYTVFQCWGKSKAHNKIYLIDQIRGKWEAPELLVQAVAFWRKHAAMDSSSTLRSMNIEDKSSGTGLIQQLKRDGIPIKAIQRNTDKLTRVMDVAPHVECGNVFLPENAAWLSDYLSEAATFPKGKHDDQIDPTADAINEMLISQQEILIA